MWVALRSFTRAPVMCRLNWSAILRLQMPRSYLESNSVNTNPQTTPVIYQNYNVGDFPATVIDSEEAEFDARLELLRQEAEAERRQETLDIKIAQIKKQEEWLRQYPI